MQTIYKKHYLAEHPGYDIGINWIYTFFHKLFDPQAPLFLTKHDLPPEWKPLKNTKDSFLLQGFCFFCFRSL